MAPPVALMLGSAIGGIAGGVLPSLLGGGGGNSSPSPSPQPTPAAPIQQPQGTPGGNAATAGGGGTTPSFIGASSLPQQQGYGTKTLLGQ